ncbi:hypothetical protein [Dyella amyloliquefaciens]|uniref:hypothetical protein n=1 Tax=Dyella amyloliquefaciens TaxID=1770545 RepID=UPI00102E5118|nr:hypothetical protein [Dyella amyloliquefaciens]
MSSLWTNLLFMHGHITDPALARRLAETPKASSRPSGKRQRSKATASGAQGKVASPGPLAQGGCA